MDILRREVAYALRTLGRTQALSMGAILVLGLGVGMATTILSLAEQVLLHPLPIKDPDRVAVLWATGLGGTEIPMGPGPLGRFRARTQALSAVAGFGHWGAAEAAIGSGDLPRHLRQAQVTGNFFEVIGATPVIGRLLLPSDRAEGNESVAVISFATWQGLYRGDPNIVGKQVKWLATGASHTIVGVAPAGLDYPIGTDLWMPAWVEGPVDLVGRLAPGRSIEAARAELAGFVADEAKSQGNPSLVGAFAQTLPVAVTGDVRPALSAMTIAALLLLLIACTNVGNLLILRAGSRLQESAVRRALGASRAALVRQSVIESTLLAVGGGLVGFLVAVGLLRLFIVIAPRDFPRVDMVRVDGWVLLSGFAITLFTAVVTGLAPLMSSGQSTERHPLLRSDHRGGTESRGRQRTGQLLVVSQVALAMVLVAGAGLVARSLIRLETLDLGFATSHLSVVEMVPPPGQFDNDYVGWIRLLDRALAALRQTPGVVAASPVAASPFTGSNTFTVALEAEGREAVPGLTTPIVSWEGVGAGFFETLDLPLLRGRGVTDEDGRNTRPVVVVTEAIARHLWPGLDPIGRRVRFVTDTGERKWRTVVGVAGELHFRDLRVSTPTAFFPYAQLPFWQGTVMVRTRGDPGIAAEGIRRALKEATPDMPVWRLQSMPVALDAPLARPRFNAILLSGFGFAALVLAAIGLFVLASTGVRQRYRELGIRLALGATPGRLQRHVLREALVLLGFGGAIGVIVALAGSQLLARLLFQVTPGDPIAFLTSAAALLAAGLLASYLPARQASRVDPVQALRAE